MNTDTSETRMLRRMASATTRAILRRIEPVLLNRAGELREPPVFIIGPPRSGTTLMYQLLTTCFETAYLCNGANRCADSPAAVTLLLQSWIRRYSSDFKSNYGRTSGRCGPHEGGRIWAKWFGWGYITEEDVSDTAASEAGATVSAIASILRAPFVSKMVQHSTRIRALDHVFPGCVFIRMRRDPVATARSIFVGRQQDRVRQSTRSAGSWWSVRPKEFEQIRSLDVVGQVCQQVVCTERNIDADLGAIGEKRCIVATYEDLCDRPRDVLWCINDFLRDHHISVVMRSAPPLSFPRSDGPQLEEHETRAIEELLRKLQNHAIERVI